MAHKDPRLIGGIPVDDVTGLLKDFSAKLGSYTVWELKMFLKRINPFPKERDITVPEGMEPGQALEILDAVQSGEIDVSSYLKTRELLAEMKQFYTEVLPEVSADKLDFSALVLPAKQEGFNWLLVMAQGLTADQLYNKCKKRFGAWRYYEDFSKVTSIRNTNHAYAIWLRDRIEADEENKNKSANQCEKEGINGITLEERLLLELWYHWKTGQHLDINNWTLCTGSRSAGGVVPGVDWVGCRMGVRYSHPADDSRDGVRVRAVVSLDPAKGGVNS